MKLERRQSIYSSSSLLRVPEVTQHGNKSHACSRSLSVNKGGESRWFRNKRRDRDACIIYARGLKRLVAKSVAASVIRTSLSSRGLDKGSIERSTKIRFSEKVATVRNSLRVGLPRFRTVVVATLVVFFLLFFSNF